MLDSFFILKKLMFLFFGYFCVAFVQAFDNFIGYVKCRIEINACSLEKNGIVTFGLVVFLDERLY